MVPRARIELARCYHRGILSPLRLPISPPRLWCYLWKKRDYSLSMGLISSPYFLLNKASRDLPINPNYFQENGPT